MISLFVETTGEICYTRGAMNKILIIEDDTSLLKAYKEKLIREGFGVQGVTDGEAGLALALKEHPDLILLDILLPKMDGMEVMKELRSDQWGNKVPIIILTNLETDDERLRIITKGEPAYYLMKLNYTIAEVVSKIKEVLAKPRR